MNEPVGRIVSLVSAALLLGACGGGGGDAGGTPTPPASTGTAQIYGIVNTFSRAPARRRWSFPASP
jgi:hypothetical protein